MQSFIRPVAALLAVLVLGGCVSLPRERGYAETAVLVDEKIGKRPAWSSEAALAPMAAAEVPKSPLSVDDAVGSAFVNNPRIRESYARIGIGRADLEQARRIANPEFGYANLKPLAGDGSQIMRSLSLGFTDLLLLPARKRFAVGDLERLQKSVASELVELATEVEVAWYESVSAQQIAAMRDLVARASENSAELAQRFFDAGNINRLQLEQELAAATHARIAAVRADADALRARSALAELIGLPVEASWTTHEKLPAPRDIRFAADDLLPLAMNQRLDLAALRQEVALQEDALGVARRWRWLGAVDVGYEREHEPDGGIKRGPTLSLQLPLFDQGQAAITRAESVLGDARARLDALAMKVHNQAFLGIQRLTMQRDIANRYRKVLVPRREAIVARTQEQVNFMLKGVFELIVARQEEYDAYQEYLESVRDYWIAYADLKRIVGGRLPDDSQPTEATVSVDAMLPAEDAPSMDHSTHAAPDDRDESAPSGAKDDPHSGHQMPMSKSGGKTSAKSNAADDPHAHHHHGDTP